MPELSILMKLKDEITTKIKAIMDLFKEFITHSEELAKTREELSEKERIIEEIMAEERAAILEAEENEAKRQIELMEEVYGKKEELTDKERALQEIMAEERAAIIECAEAEAIREIVAMEKVYGKRKEVSDKEAELHERFVLIHDEWLEALARGDLALAESLKKKLQLMKEEKDAQNRAYLESIEEMDAYYQSLRSIHDGAAEGSLQEMEDYYKSLRSIHDGAAEGSLKRQDEHHKSLRSSTETHLKEMLEQQDDFYTKVADLIDDSIKKEETLIDTLGDHKEATEELTDVLPDFSRELSQVSLDLSSAASMAAAAAAEVRELRDQISKLRSKTITITVIHRDIYIVKTKSGGGGSNPFSVSPGVPSSAEDKVFTERRILPALKTLSREGKFAKEVVLT